MNRFYEWMDRALGVAAGVAGITAVHAYQDGHMVSAGLGAALTASALWLSRPEMAHGKSLGVLLSELDRERLIRHLSVVYGVESGDPMLSATVPGGWDPFGTPIVWCRVKANHEPHLWENMGPAYAPVLCMGHECTNPDKHMTLQRDKDGIAR